MFQPNCLACQINSGAKAIPGGVVSENEHWLADHYIGPFGVGSFVVKIKVHRDSLWEITEDEANSLGPFLQAVSEAMVKALGAEQIYLSMWVDKPQRAKNRFYWGGQRCLYSPSELQS